MTNKLEKCPNCGHKFKDGEKYCPNCDLFVPIDDHEEPINGYNGGETRPFNKFTDNQSNHSINENQEKSSLFKHRTKQADDNSEIETEIKTDDKVQTQKENHMDIANEKALDSKIENDPITMTDLEVLSPSDTNEPEEYSDLKTNENEESESLPSRVDNGTKHPTTNKKKWWLVFIIIILIGIACVAYYSIQKKNSIETARVALVDKTTDYIDELYLTKNHDYLKSGITAADFEKAKNSLDKLKTQTGYDELKETYDEAEEKFKKQEAVNALFNQPIINGDQLADDVYVKDSSTLTIKKVTKESDGFYKLYNEAIDVANSQIDELKETEEKVSLVFKDDAVVESATRDQYNSAKEAVDALKNVTLKNDYSDQLDKVNDFLTEKEEKEAQAAKEAAEKEEAAAQANAQQANSNSTTNSSGSTTGYRWGNRQDATIDLSDPAWTWNPGIQNEVISEVIKRGYVVEGGYTLVPKYIENGAGFYDLYATTNSKIFPDSKASEFPLFVVTINDKTGSFYGNGPN